MLVLIHSIADSLTSPPVFQQSSLSEYPAADGYAFNNIYPRGSHLDQGEAAVAFKPTPNRHVDR